MSEFERWLGQDLDDKDLTAELEAVKDQPEEINGTWSSVPEACGALLARAPTA